MNALVEYPLETQSGAPSAIEPWLGPIWLVSDLVIFAAFMAITLAIFIILKRRPDIMRRGLLVLLAGFAFLCGITQTLSFLTAWFAIYPLIAAMKMATGLVGLAAAAMLFRSIPALVRIPNPDAHDKAITQLEATLAELAMSRKKLDKRVKARTAELKQANIQLSFTARDAVRRSRNLIQTVSALTQPGENLKEDPRNFIRELRGRINSLAIATSTLMEHDNVSWASVERLVRRQIEPLFAEPDARISVSGPMIEAGPEGAQQLSLVAWELAQRFLKLGSWDHDNARIEVRWFVTPAHPENPEDDPLPCECGEAACEHKTDQFTFEWREVLNLQDDPADDFGAADFAMDDYGIATTPQALAGFSGALLTRIVPRLLKGEARMEAEGSTFVYRLQCPLSAVSNAAKQSRGIKNAERPAPKAIGRRHFQREA